MEDAKFILLLALIWKENMRGKKRTAKCHPDKKHYAYGLCKNCYNKKYREEYNKNYRIQHAQEQKERAKNWYNKNKEEVIKRTTVNRLATYGWTIEGFKYYRFLQRNKCAICGVPFHKTPNADHKHVIPPVPRGLLCDSCNKSLGGFKDDPAILRKAAEYLEQYDSGA